MLPITRGWRAPPILHRPAGRRLRRRRARGLGRVPLGRDLIGKRHACGNQPTERPLGALRKLCIDLGGRRCDRDRTQLAGLGLVRFAFGDAGNDDEGNDTVIAGDKIEGERIAAQHGQKIGDQHCGIP